MKEIFDEILNTFENKDLRLFAEARLEDAPAYWWKVPASSTGKYHPQYALGEGGLVRHTLALCRILNHFFEVESISKMFSSRDRDLLRIAGIIHDMWKSGTQAEYEKAKWTRFDHPLIVANMLRDADNLPINERVFIAQVVSSHMGQWNTDKRHPDVVLPKPENKYQIILHLADYLASRKDIEINFDVPAGREDPKPDINTWRFTFGKHSGKTIPEVDEIDHQYIVWAKENMTKEPARSLLQGYGQTNT